jgi:hypothetical protein
VVLSFDCELLPCTFVYDLKCFVLEEIKRRRLNLGNACYHSVLNLFFFFLSAVKKTRNKMYRSIILSVVLCGCKTSSVTLMEEHRVGVFENRV